MFMRIRTNISLDDGTQRERYFSISGIKGPQYPLPHLSGPESEKREKACVCCCCCVQKYLEEGDAPGGEEKKRSSPQAFLFFLHYVCLDKNISKGGGCLKEAQKCDGIKYKKYINLGPL